MQVTETRAEGLKREYKLIVSAADLDARTNEKLEEIRRDVHLKGFRKGKAPLRLMKQRFGKSVLGEVVQETVESSVAEHLKEQGHRPARQPDVKIANEKFDEGDDLNVEITYECLPEVPEVDFGQITLERRVVEVDDAALDEALKRLADSSTDYEARPEGEPAEEGDQVVIDFTGRIDGEPFEGGEAEDYPLVLGSGSFIPGFEEQLTGLEAGAEKTIEVTFPEAYGQPDLAGKPATFDVKVKEVRAPAELNIDDEFAKGQGFDDLAAMKEAIRTSMEGEYGRYSRAKAKRAVLDHLAERYRFDVPAGMVDLEFEAIWKQIQEEIEKNGNDSGKSEQELREEYRAIAERRVRLGLILSDVGQKNDLKVEQHEINRAVIEQAQRYPGQEQKVVEFFRSNPQAIEQLRAPLYEDKVIDFILEMATVEEQTVTPEELMRDPDDEAGEPAQPAA